MYHVSEVLVLGMIAICRGNETWKYIPSLSFGMDIKLIQKFIFRKKKKKKAKQTGHAETV